jgi:serine/threonine protein kinase
MTSEPPQATEQPADWEAFYRDYRKPGFIEGFEITTKLGGGMFGLVFRAKRMSIGKDYAIKFLKVDDGEVRRAVLSELEQVKYFAQIDHPNLVSIEDRGEVSGIPYLVMAFAGTETLRDQMPVDAAGVGRRPEPAEKNELVRAFLQSCRGLQALHDRSLVHFDIKPANVFLKGGVARLGDYGLSKLMTHSRGSLSMGRGTPYYMAPEMLQRRGDARSDIYSLGVMLYEILCGKVPFAGDSEWEVLKKHETAEPELPSHLTATERAVLQRSLQKDPAQRFESVQQLIEALGAPASSAAATCNDVREGVRVSPAPSPPPPPPPAPPPGASSAPDAHRAADPYREMAAASRKAFQHANQVAREAMREASATARKAAKQAQEKWHESWDRTRHHSVRRWHAWTRLRKMKRGADRSEALRVAAAIHAPRSASIAGEAGRQRSSRLRQLVWTGAALAAVVVATMAIWLAALVPTSMPTSIPPDRDVLASAGGWPVAGTANAPQPSRVAFASASEGGLSNAPVFNYFRVPTRYSKLVSVKEPDWARLRADNRSQSKQLLLQHIEQLRRQAPMSPAQRVKAELPEFGQTKQLANEQRVRAQLAELMTARSYDSKLAASIVARGPVGLSLAAQAMAELNYDDKQDVEKARRLHRLLVDATKCRDLTFVSSGSLDKVGESNRALGRLWLWFVNEFAHTECAWSAYRKLLRI